MATNNGNPWGPVPPPGNRPNGGPGNGQNGGNRGNNGLPPFINSLLEPFLKQFKGGGGGGPRPPVRPPFGGGGFALPAGPKLAAGALIVFAALWLASGIYVVQPDQQGVILRFGAVVGTSGPGLNYHLPWPIDRVLLPAVTRINRTEIGYTTSPQQDPNSGSISMIREDVPAESEMLTGDQNIVDINVAVFWQIKNAQGYLFNVRNPDETVKAVAESVIREVIGRTPIEPAMTSARASIEQAVQRETQIVLDRYGAGVQVDEVQLQKVDPPPEVIDSFRDVQRAHTDAERIINEAHAYENTVVPAAKGQAAQVIAAAQAQREAAIADAQGQAARFLSVLAAYDAAKDITLQRLDIETMQDIMSHAHTTIIDPSVKSVLPMLPLQNGAKP